MGPICRLLTLLQVLNIAITSVVRAQVTSQEVRLAIDRGVDYLRKKQSAQGGWRDGFDFRGDFQGSNALATLALINCGVPKDDEVMKRALTNYSPSRIELHLHRCLANNGSQRSSSPRGKNQNTP